ncbi:hypothetical protein [Sorangium sp. So ce233]|uniref:hypothetical protein n=1 Tax=Sorangium sp. So ce233 TaxID=3133290 RepID=UPI003F5DD4DB
MILRSLPVLEAARPLLPRELVDDGAWARVTRVAGSLPSAMVLHSLECRLAGGASQVDYLACAARRDGSAPMLAASDPRRWFDLDASAETAPARIGALLAAWGAPTSAMADAISAVWLEFDLDGVRRPVPRVGLCVDPNLGHGSHAPSREPTEAAEQALALLRGGLSASARSALRRAIEALPPGGRAVHVGVAVASPEEWLRCVPALPREDIPGYFERLGWRLPPSAREALDELCIPRDGRAKIDVDIVDGELLPKLGVFSELWPHGAAVRGAAGALLDRLVDRGLCTIEKQEALCRWPGRSTARIEGVSWPIALDRMVDLKIVLWPDGRHEAKAYLALAPRLDLF